MHLKDLQKLPGGTTKISELFGIEGKIVLVTGGGRGIGLMIAMGFVENGAKVIIASRNGEECTRVAEALTKRGPGTCYAIGADLSKESECKKVAEEIEKKEGKLDILVNNAGANWGQAYEEFPDSAWDRVLALNVKSVFHLTKFCTPMLAKSAEQSKTPSCVINIGSIDGLRIPTLETYSYTASKAAVHHLTKVLAAKLADKNITVNAIAAGAFETKMMAATLEKYRDALVENIPLKRIGTPADIVGICIYLSSKSGSWVTGAIIPVEGGILSKASL